MKKELRKICGRPPKLTKEQVNDIKKWAAARRALPSIQQIADNYGVHKSTIYDLIRTERMHHVD